MGFLLLQYSRFSPFWEQEVRYRVSLGMPGLVGEIGITGIGVKGLGFRV